MSYATSPNFHLLHTHANLTLAVTLCPSLLLCFSCLKYTL
uniref:Uncharacterized protein n=1 Tax=Anguilla anguilla TaxID=7936 RepID=A0A0E9PXW8_ANGAN